MTEAPATCLIITLLLCQSFHSGFSSSSHWNYKHEDDWPNTCKEGIAQSPIALERHIAEEKHFNPFVFERYNTTYPIQSINNGHSAEIRLHVPTQPAVRGGGLPNRYILDNVHFHWDSEHTIDGYRFPLEMHLVHYSIQHQSLANALKHHGGVAVLSVLFDLSPDDDEEFEPLISVVERLQNLNEVKHTYLVLEEFLPRDTAGFYRYSGSLTTPDCTEGVIWTVFTNTLPISKKQLEMFANLKTENNEKLAKNYRALQPLNGRQVEIKVSPIRSPASRNYVSKTALIFVLLLFVKF